MARDAVTTAGFSPNSDAKELSVRVASAAKSALGRSGSAENSAGPSGLEPVTSGVLQIQGGAGVRRSKVQ